MFLHFVKYEIDPINIHRVNRVWIWEDLKVKYESRNNYFVISWNDKKRRNGQRGQQEWHEMAMGGPNSVNKSTAIKHRMMVLDRQICFISSLKKEGKFGAITVWRNNKWDTIARWNFSRIIFLNKQWCQRHLSLIYSK